MLDLDRIEAALAKAPGPWRTGTDWYAREVRDAAGSGVAWVGGGTDREAHALAKALASLPALVAELRAARAEIERLRGLVPELPPRPPEGDGVPRYGLRWGGPSQPVAVPMVDGYWTPWHLAEREIERLRTAAADERAYVVAWLRGMGRGFASHLASEFEQGAHVGAAKGANHG